MSGLLVIMGSGETAPTMVKPHRSILQRVGDRRAVLLDTPYGFQSNADDISARAVHYFATSVGRTIDVVSWRRPPADTLTRERALAALHAAGWIFAGPGSPTYTLRQWRDTPIPDLLAGKLADGVVCFASAAALTLGSHTVPVYEIDLARGGAARRIPAAAVRSGGLTDGRGGGRAARLPQRVGAGGTQPAEHRHGGVR